MFDMMPDMDGIETLQNLRSGGLIGDNTAVIAMTANAVTGARDNYLSYGFEGYLSKPIAVDKLENELEKHLPQQLISYRTNEDKKNTDSAQNISPKRDDSMNEITYTHAAMPKSCFPDNCSFLDIQLGMGYCGGDKELHRLQTNLAREVKRQTKYAQERQERMERLSRETVLALAKAVEVKDQYTNGHSGRVAYYARLIAERAGMSESDQNDIYFIGLLHNIGKIGVPDTVINKTTRWHHERYDGTGYPDGISGEEIPVFSRIICVADAYDAMTSTRSYRDILPQQKVREELVKGKGTQFDPEFADIMISLIDEDKDYKMRR